MLLTGLAFLVAGIVAFVIGGWIFAAKSASPPVSAIGAFCFLTWWIAVSIGVVLLLVLIIKGRRRADASSVGD